MTSVDINNNKVYGVYSNNLEVVLASVPLTCLEETGSSSSPSLSNPVNGQDTLIWTGV
jgi:hypothetical protein